MDTIVNLLINLLLYIWTIAKVIIPLMIVIEIFKDLNLVERISTVFKPVTKFFTISEKSGISLILGLIFGLLLGAGSIIQSVKDYNIDKRSVFLVCMFMSLCHAVFEDTLLFASIGANLPLILIARIIAATLTTFILSRIIKKDSELADNIEIVPACSEHNHN